MAKIGKEKKVIENEPAPDKLPISEPLVVPATPPAEPVKVPVGV